MNFKLKPRKDTNSIEQIRHQKQMNRNYQENLLESELRSPAIKFPLKKTKAKANQNTDKQKPNRSELEIFNNNT